MILKDLKKGDFFRLVNNDSAPVWVRGDFDRTTKKYFCYKYEDINHETAIKSARVVYSDFIF